MGRLRERHVTVFDEVGDAHAIIGLRNRLIHGYDSVDDAIIWDVIQSKLPNLETAVRGILSRSG
jgi:uncharacterized protein with HEPN domain